MASGFVASGGKNFLLLLVCVCVIFAVVAGGRFFSLLGPMLAVHSLDLLGPQLQSTTANNNNSSGHTVRVLLVFADVAFFYVVPGPCFCCCRCRARFFWGPGFTHSLASSVRATTAKKKKT